VAKKKSTKKILSKENGSSSSAAELKSHCPVVAIGASSGGIQALTEFLENIPPDLGMAYIVVQHLSPTHKSILPEILSKKTKMNVIQVTDGMEIHKDNVYVIPPNTFMSAVDGRLTLSEREKGRAGYHSIDHFLETLAPVYQTKAVAVILSGSGTDGTFGIESIKAHGGVTFAQDESAAFSGMPKTATDSGYTDFVLSPKRIAEDIASLAKNPTGLFTINEQAEADKDELGKIQVLLHNKKGVDFSYYKQTMIHRRIRRRMLLNKFKHLTEYMAYLRENSQEVELLYKDLLINVTSFFRDPNVYNALAKKILPEIFKSRKQNETIRIWAPACANGEEAYSLAITVFDFLRNNSLNTPIQIFGTDLNETAIEKARSGIYPKSALMNVPARDLDRYFIKTDGRYQIIKSIRDVCIFATHNLLKDPPFSRMDVISCQNVLIYIETNPQKKILHAFHYSLKPTGYLVLGRSETIGNSTELFSQMDKDLKVYAKKEAPLGNTLFDYSLRIPYSFARSQDARSFESVAEIDIEKETDKLLLSRYVPASVLVNKDLQILRFHGSTSNYLQPSSGRASLNLLKMVKDEFLIELKGLINRVKKSGVTERKEGIHIVQNGVEREIAIEVVPVKSSINEFFYLIIFKEIAAVITPVQIPGSDEKDPKDERLAHVEQQLNEARDYMKIMSEEFEATREELQSANEEVLSSNEELQSINEELETSKEELQSTNEELTTINEELLQRNIDLKEVSDFSKAIVETINEPLLVLTNDMRVVMANKAFYSRFKTNADRTEGHYFFEMDGGVWNMPQLKKKLVGIIDGEKAFENCQITKDFPSIGEKTLLFKALRMEQDNKMDRFLLIIQDISNWLAQYKNKSNKPK
jgi:two-component system CheB/CheR fusion protein